MCLSEPVVVPGLQTFEAAYYRARAGYFGTIVENVLGSWNLRGKKTNLPFMISRQIELSLRTPLRDVLHGKKEGREEKDDRSTSWKHTTND